MELKVAPEMVSTSVLWEARMVLFDENNLNAEVTIINQEQPEATPTVTPEETITPTPTPGTSTGVKTGDDTPIGFYMALLFVAALAIEETTRRRRKKEQD